MADILLFYWREESTWTVGENSMNTLKVFQFKIPGPVTCRAAQCGWLAAEFISLLKRTR
jgi:hypothetical protein